MEYKNISEKTTHETQVVIDKALEIFSYCLNCNIMSPNYDEFLLFEKNSISLDIKAKISLSLLIAILTTDNDVKNILINYGISSDEILNYYQFEQFHNLKSFQKEFLFDKYFSSYFKKLCRENYIFSPLGIIPETIIIETMDLHFITSLFSNIYGTDIERNIISCLPYHIKAMQLIKFNFLSDTTSCNEEETLYNKSLKYVDTIDEIVSSCDVNDCTDLEYEIILPVTEDVSSALIMVTDKQHALEFLKIFNNLPINCTYIKYTHLSSLLLDKSFENTDGYKIALKKLKESLQLDQNILEIGNFLEFLTIKNPSTFQWRLALAILHHNYPIFTYVNETEYDKLNDEDIASNYVLNDNLASQTILYSSPSLKYQKINKTPLTNKIIIECLETLINLDMQNKNEDILQCNITHMLSMFYLFSPHLDIKEYEFNIKYLKDFKKHGIFPLYNTNFNTCFKETNNQTINTVNNKILQFKIEEK